MAVVGETDVLTGQSTTEGCPVIVSSVHRAVMRSAGPKPSAEKETMLHIKANGTIAQLPPERLTLEQMKALVGGYIELVWPMTADGRKICMVVNEEGHCHSLPP